MQKEKKGLELERVWRPLHQDIGSSWSLNLSEIMPRVSFFTRKKVKTLGTVPGPCAETPPPFLACNNKTLVYFKHDALEFTQSKEHYSTIENFSDIEK